MALRLGFLVAAGVAFGSGACCPPAIPALPCAADVDCPTGQGCLNELCVSRGGSVSSSSGGTSGAAGGTGSPASGSSGSSGNSGSESSGGGQTSGGTSSGSTGGAPTSGGTTIGGTPGGSSGGHPGGSSGGSCLALGEGCGGAANCCSGLECETVGGGPNDECCVPLPSSGTTANCDPSGEPGGGVCCGSGICGGTVNTTNYTACCMELGGTCNGNVDCCRGSCPGGTCVCDPHGAMCVVPEDCCSGGCGNAGGNFVCCYPAGSTDTCAIDADCCAGSSCCPSGTCQSSCGIGGDGGVCAMPGLACDAKVGVCCAGLNCGSPTLDAGICCISPMSDGGPYTCGGPTGSATDCLCCGGGTATCDGGFCGPCPACPKGQTCG